MLALTTLLAVQLQVIVPEPRNLQDLSFWVALGAGYFAEEGLAVEVVAPEIPNEVVKRLDPNAEQVFVLPPPIYLRLIADGFPIRLIANLLKNDPINLVVSANVVAARKLVVDAPLAVRLRALRGLRIGVAPGPRSRLRALFAGFELDAATHVEIVPLMGQEQNEAFGAGRVDALYAHTPYLERALVDQGAVLYVNQSAGELPARAFSQIHVLAVTARFAAAHPDRVRGLVRAIALAQRLIHRDQPAAVEATLRAVPGLERRHVERLVQLYAPAVPATPELTVAGIRSARALYPEGQTPPDLSRVDLRTVIVRPGRVRTPTDSRSPSPPLR